MSSKQALHLFIHELCHPTFPGTVTPGCYDTTVSTEVFREESQSQPSRFPEAPQQGRSHSQCYQSGNAAVCRPLAAELIISDYT